MYEEDSENWIIYTLNAKDDIKKLDLLSRQIQDMNLNNSNAITTKDKLNTKIKEQINDLIAEIKLDYKEYLELIEENKDYKKMEKRKEQMAEDRLYMIWENGSYKEIAEILRNSYSYTDEEIINEFSDEEIRKEVENYLTELNEIDEELGLE